MNNATIEWHIGTDAEGICHFNVRFEAEKNEYFLREAEMFIEALAKKTFKDNNQMQHVTNIFPGNENSNYHQIKGEQA